MTGKTQKIRLMRPESGGFGFYIRGGAEHGLGIYVSDVEVGSEAHLQGLRKGDQILKVCGMYVDQATTKEVTFIIKDRNTLDLKVRSGGVIPVKDVKCHPVSWRIVQDNSIRIKEIKNDDIDEGVKMEDDQSKISTIRAKTPTSRREDPIRGRRRSVDEVRGRRRSEEDVDLAEETLNISMHGQQGLGCSICKGPPEKPGIFVQSTKAGKLAREKGLRPGDQIIHCNGIDFLNIPFGDAVYHLKASKDLNLVIRKRAGLDLFPSESSGYDSSSAGSSVGGETDKSTGKTTIKTSFPVPVAPPVPAPPPATISTAAPKSAAEIDLERERKKLLSEQERLRQEQLALDEERKRLEEEKKIFRNTVGKANGSEFVPSRIKDDSRQQLQQHQRQLHSSLQQTLSDTSVFSGSSSATTAASQSKVSDSSDPDSDTASTTASSLAAALQSEIRRRAEKNTSESRAPSTGSRTPSGSRAPVTKGILKKTESPSLKKVPFITEKNDKHDLLIAEFKQAHKKMFPADTTGLETANLEEDDSTEVEDNSEAEKGTSKPKAPPPPPGKSSQLTTIYSSITTISSTSSDSSNTKSLSTFKPDRGKDSSSEDGKERVGGGLPVFVPGIPTPDYDSTPDRSPLSHRKLYSRNRNPGKHVVPPTVEGISRAKSLTSLVTPSETKDMKMKGRAPHPGTLVSATSMKDVSRDTNSIHSVHSSLRSSEAPSLSFSYSSKSSFNQERKDYPDGYSSKVSQFSRRHREVESVSMESFQLEQAKPVEHKPPATYFESLKPSPLVTVQTYGEKENFQFQTKPCHPSQIPNKPDGEEAKIASKDYRAVNAQPRLKPLGEVSTFKPVKEDKSRGSIKEEKNRGFKKEEKSRGFAKFTGLKKPAPPPPVLRKI